MPNGVRGVSLRTPVSFGYLSQSRMQFGTSPFSAFSFSSEISGSSLNMKERKGRYPVQSPINTGINYLFHPTTSCCLQPAADELTAGFIPLKSATLLYARALPRHPICHKKLLGSARRENSSKLEVIKCLFYQRHWVHAWILFSC